jgi:hypothetical protein
MARTPPNGYPSRRMRIFGRRQLSGGAADPSREGAEAVKRGRYPLVAGSSPAGGANNLQNPR